LATVTSIMRGKTPDGAGYFKPESVSLRTI
jgi:hypothetical protein